MSHHCFAGATWGKLEQLWRFPRIHLLAGSPADPVPVTAFNFGQDAVVDRGNIYHSRHKPPQDADNHLMALTDWLIDLLTENFLGTGKTACRVQFCIGSRTCLSSSRQIEPWTVGHLKLLVLPSLQACKCWKILPKTQVPGGKITFPNYDERIIAARVIVLHLH